MCLLVYVCARTKLVVVYVCALTKLVVVYVCAGSKRVATYDDTSIAVSHIVDRGGADGGSAAVKSLLLSSLVRGHIYSGL